MNIYQKSIFDQKQKLNQELNNFKERLEKKLSNVNEISNKNLRYQISPKELEKVLIHALVLTDNNPTIINLKPNSAELIKQGHSISINYRIQKTPRSFEIIRTEDGEYQLILEPKCKLANHSPTDEKKDNSLMVRGAQKYGKPAFRIDLEQPKELMTFKNLSEYDKPEMRNELEISRKLNGKLGRSPFFCVWTFTGKTYKGKLQITTERGESDLHTFIINDFFESKKNKINIILNLLNAVKHMHSKKIIHQDLKPKNIIMFKTSYGSHIPKISDFGTSFIINNHKDKGLSQASAGYASPQIILSGHLAYYFDDYEHKNYDLLSKSYAKEISADANEEQPETNKYPAKENDIWALGIIIAEIITSKINLNIEELTEVMEEHSFLKGMLEKKASDRSPIDKAMIEFLGSYYYKEKNSYSDKDTPQRSQPHTYL